MTDLFTPGTLGDIAVKNRVFMAPLTRSRAHLDGTPNEISAKYYAQRASAGLIIAEATQISQQGQGYIATPGVYNAEHAKGWKTITDSVHSNGGKIILQLWHVGRISHSSLQPEGQQPVAPSAIQANMETFTAEGSESVSKPRAIELTEIKELVNEYARSAKLAIEAGFDGVEIHAANGYLLNQFISSSTNKRDDEYGGSLENRSKIIFEIIDAVTAEIGHGRVGVRLSPTGTFNDIEDPDAEDNYSYIYSEIDKRNLAYLHVVERFPGFPVSRSDEALLQKLRNNFSGNYIGNGDYDKQRGNKAIADGAFAISFGRLFISNPDLAERLEYGAPLTELDPDTFYGGDEKGYSDYPFWKQDAA